MKELIQMLLDFTAVSWDRGFAVVIIIGALSGALVKIMLAIRGIFKDYFTYLWKKRKKAVKENYQKFLKHVMETHADEHGKLQIIEDGEELDPTIDKVVKDYMK